MIMLEIYLFFVALFTVLTLISPWHRLMTVITLCHMVFNLIFVFYCLSDLFFPGYTTIELPWFYFEQYLFLDELSLYLMFLTAITFFFATIFSQGYVHNLMLAGALHPQNLRFFYVTYNLLYASINFTFFCNNLVLFLVFAELTTIFGSALIVTLNVKENIDAATKYIFITSTALVFTLIGLIFLSSIATESIASSILPEPLNWYQLMRQLPNLSSNLLLITFLFILVGLMAKSGIVPFHTWLPHVYSMAPSVVSAVLSGAVINVGIYGVIRIFALIRQNQAIWQIISPLMMFFGVLAMSVGSLSMLPQKDLKKLIAFSSVEQMGFLLLAISIGTHDAIFWVVFYLVANAWTKGTLFLSAGVLHRQFRSNESSTMFDVMKIQPVASLGLIFGTGAIIGLPPFALFVPKFMILLEVGKKSLEVMFIALLMFLLVMSAFTVFHTQLFSQLTVHKGMDVIKPFSTPLSMKIPIIGMIVLILILGIYIPETAKTWLERITVDVLGFGR